MLDIRALRQDGEAIKAALAKRGYSLDLAAFAELDARRKQADVRSQDLQAERKKASKQIGQLIQSGMNVDEAKAKVAETLKTLDAELDQEVANAKAIHDEISEFLMGVPNVPQEAVPEGNDEEDNVEVRTWGEPRVLDFEARDHVDIGEGLTSGALDFDSASIVRWWISCWTFIAANTAMKRSMYLIWWALKPCGERANYRNLPKTCSRWKASESCI